MKHLYLLFISVFAITNLHAQRNLNSHLYTFDSRVNYPQFKFENEKAANDVLFLFDGRFAGGKGVDSTTFQFKGEDLDSLTIDTTYTNYNFPLKASFVPTIDVKAPGDTNFYYIAVSYFKIPGGKANDWISFGPVKIPTAGATLHWKHNYPYGDNRDGYKVHVNTVGIGAKNFTAPPIYTITDNDATTITDTAITPHVIFYPRSKSLSAYAGQSVYIGLQHDAKYMDALSIDDVMVIENSFLQTIHESNLEESVTIYPNPSLGLFTVNFPSSTKRLVEVYNGFGELLYSNNFSTTTVSLDLTDFNSGVYSMKVSSSNNKTTLKQLVIIK